jgi:hypothetical protein
MTGDYCGNDVAGIEVLGPAAAVRWSSASFLFARRLLQAPSQRARVSSSGAQKR